MRVSHLKTQGIASLKKRLWKEFSLFIKLRHSVDGNYCFCITCGQIIRIGDSSCHAGHYLNKKSFSVHYFDERNVRPQCAGCNTYSEGETITFRENLIGEIGIDQVEDLERTRHGIAKRSRAWYIDKIIHYANEIQKLRA